MFSIKNHRSLIANWFKNRFNHSLESDYFQSWKNRDKRKGVEYLLAKMDFSSRRAFIKTVLNWNGFLPSSSIYVKFGKFLVCPNERTKRHLINAIEVYISSH